jgi:hypothetical protein
VIKKCVFCNKNPIEKNKEHVIPQWLIELTGGFNRKINLMGMKGEKISFNFKNFTFPACKICNSKYSELEIKAENVVNKLLQRKSLSSDEFEILFDWLDKVRIGLWLGSLMFFKNPIGIVPKFGITERPKKDRIIFISLTSQKSKRLNFSGFNDPLFQFLPCFLGLYINGLSIISLSSDFLLAGELSFPNFKVISESRDKDPAVIFENYENNYKFSIPYLGKKFTLLGQINYPIKLDKSIFSKDLLKYLKDDLKSSRVFFIKKGKLFLYPTSPSTKWIPNEFGNGDNLFSEQNRKFLRLRDWIAMKKMKSSSDIEFREIYKNLILNEVINEIK